MRTHLLAALLLGVTAVADAASTIDANDRYTYGANVGWMDWRADGANGVTVNRLHLGGFLYAANIGWISLGDGSPANGTAYSNTAANDCGVNCSSSGTDLNLSGYAYSANVGWISFNVAGANRPRIDKATGRFHGHAYGANIGWIALEQASATLSTDPAPLADPTPTATPSPTVTPSPSPSSTPTASPSPLPTPDVLPVLLGIRAAVPADDANGDGLVDVADLK